MTEHVFLGSIIKRAQPGTVLYLTVLSRTSLSYILNCTKPVILPLMDYKTLNTKEIVAADSAFLNSVNTRRMYYYFVLAGLYKLNIPLRTQQQKTPKKIEFTLQKPCPFNDRC